MPMLKIIVAEYQEAAEGSFITVLSDSFQFGYDEDNDRKAFLVAVRDFIRSQKNLY